MAPQEELIQAIARAAESWQDPEYAPRAEAVEATLDADNPFTEESLAFAINQQMHLLSEKALRTWIQDRTASHLQAVGVIHDSQVAFSDLQDFLAVILTGHHFIGLLQPESPFLLPTFATEVKSHGGDFSAAFKDRHAFFGNLQALIATGDEEVRTSAAEEAGEHGIPPGRLLMRNPRFGVAVLNGMEMEEDWENLAEDLLLYDGRGDRRVAIIWSPAGSKPDALLDALAGFRSVFPAGDSLAGSLKMQQAFLQALKHPHAYGEGMEFLLSKGSPELQPPGHIRWSEYERLEDIAQWLQAHSEDLQLVATQPDLANTLHHLDIEVIGYGNAHRPPLGWRKDTLAFLAAL